jgi:hypothetical protein
MQQKHQRFYLGAHLIVKHFGYSHHGIYAGRGRVIHYSGFAHIFKKRLKQPHCNVLHMAKQSISRIIYPLATKPKL